MESLFFKSFLRHWHAIVILTQLCKIIIFPFLDKYIQKGWILCSRSETQSLPNIRSISLHTHFHKHTHAQHHHGPVMEEKETHFSLVNMKSWMCHSVLSAVLYVASPHRCLHYSCLSSVPRQPEWSAGGEGGGIIYIMCHLISVLRPSSQIWQSAFYEDPLPWLRRADMLGGSLTQRNTHYCTLYNTAAQHSGSPGKNTTQLLCVENLMLS